MFKRTVRLVIDSWYSMDVARLLGEVGLEFRFGGEISYADEMDARRKHYYRRWVVRGNKKKMDRFMERLNDCGIGYDTW